MTEEEYIRNRLDMINKNSHYGIMIDTEITKTVRSHIERSEEAAMHADCEFCVKKDICTRDVPKPCRYSYTEDQRKADQASDIYGAILAGMYLPKTYLKKEETKMNATSTEEFKDIIAIDFELQTFPNPDVQDKFIVSATNRDDIFCFVFEGPCLRDACRNAGLFVGWEKDQRIRELEEDVSNLKKQLHAVQLMYENSKKNHIDIMKTSKEKHEDEVEQLKQHLNQVKDYNENLKKRYDRLNKKFNRVMNDILLNEGKEVVEQKLNTREGILDQAKKCVCGQREQEYGTPESNFKIIADLWNDYLGLAENGDGVPIFSIKNITTMDVAMMMALLKIARIKNGGGSGDSFVDLAGYAACGGELWHLKKETNGDSN